MSDQDSSDADVDEPVLQLAPSSRPAQAAHRAQPKAVIRVQDATKTCRLLALEVGSLKAELTREQKKRAQALQRATQAEATLQEKLASCSELQYTNSKLRKEVEEAKDAAESSSRRVHALRQSLADAEAQARDRAGFQQEQVDAVAALLTTLQALLTSCYCCSCSQCSSSSSTKGSQLSLQLIHSLLTAVARLDQVLLPSSAGAAAAAACASADSTLQAADAVAVDMLLQQCRQHISVEQQHHDSRGGLLQQSPRAHRAPQSPSRHHSSLLQQHQEQQQSKADSLQHLAKQAALEAAQLQLQEENVHIQQQLASMQQLCAASGKQLQLAKDERAAAAQQLAAAQAEVAELRAALARRRAEEDAQQRRQQRQQEQQGREAAAAMDAMASRLACCSMTDRQNVQLPQQQKLQASHQYQQQEHGITHTCVQDDLGGYQQAFSSELAAGVLGAATAGVPAVSRDGSCSADIYGSGSSPSRYRDTFGNTGVAAAGGRAAAAVTAASSTAAAAAAAAGIRYTSSPGRSPAAAAALKQTTADIRFASSPVGASAATTAAAVVARARAAAAGTVAAAAAAAGTVAAAAAAGTVAAAAAAGTVSPAHNEAMVHLGSAAHGNTAGIGAGSSSSSGAKRALTFQLPSTAVDHARVCAAALGGRHVSGLGTAQQQQQQQPEEALHAVYSIHAAAPSGVGGAPGCSSPAREGCGAARPPGSIRPNSSNSPTAFDGISRGVGERYVATRPSDAKVHTGFDAASPSANSPRTAAMAGLAAATAAPVVAGRSVGAGPSARLGVGVGAAATTAASAAAAAATEKYQSLVREADAALQQLAACRRVADSAASAGARFGAANAGLGVGVGDAISSATASGYMQQMCPQSPSGAASWGLRDAASPQLYKEPRPYSAGMTSPAGTYRVGAVPAFNAVTGKALGLSQAGAGSPRKMSSLLVSHTAPAGTELNQTVGRYGCSIAARSIGSPLRPRPSSAGVLGTGVDSGGLCGGSFTSPGRGKAGPTSAVAQLPCLLRGELQALDNDIAAAEASLQAAAQRLSGAATAGGTTW